jgi:hypothetical protein
VDLARNQLRVGNKFSVLNVGPQLTGSEITTEEYNIKLRLSDIVHYRLI